MRLRDSKWTLASLALVAVTLWAVTFDLPPVRSVNGARQSVSKMQIEQLHKALEAYRQDTGEYPPTHLGLEGLRYNAGIRNWRGPYLTKPIPSDPWGNPFVYGLDATGRPVIRDSSQW